MMALSPGPWTIQESLRGQVFQILDANKKVVATLNNRDDSRGLILLLKLLNDFFDGAVKIDRDTHT